jgi:23S rRNA pseudouridine2605 synthase
MPDYRKKKTNAKRLDAVNKKAPNTPAHQPEEIKSDGIRLNKFLSNAGIAARRKADELIKSGKVTVNGKEVTEMGFKVKPGDTVIYAGKKVIPRTHVYVLINKPKNHITTVSDEKDRRTVMDLVKSATNERLFPVGRLDRNTTGVLLLTNDGELTNKLTHPSFKIEKVYLATLDKPLANADMNSILEGFELEDGPVKVDSLAFPDQRDKTKVGIELHEGRNHIVKRIFKHFGYQVEKLDRVLFAGLTKKNLVRGKWRHLTEKEVIRLKHFLK